MLKMGHAFLVTTSRRRMFALGSGAGASTRLDSGAVAVLLRPACFCFLPCGAPSRHGERSSYPSRETTETEIPNCAPAIPATPAEVPDM